MAEPRGSRASRESAGGEPPLDAGDLIWFRHADTRFPFLWEVQAQPPARWHGPDEGPAHYLADTPDGAWAEFLRHEGIVEVDDLATIRRDLWAVRVPPGPVDRPSLPARTLVGAPGTYRACQVEARRLRKLGSTALMAPSAALLEGEAGGFRVDRGLRPGPRRDGRVLVLFGRRPDLVGWRAASAAGPAPGLLGRVRRW